VGRASRPLPLSLATNSINPWSGARNPRNGPRDTGPDLPWCVQRPSRGFRSVLRLEVKLPVGVAAAFAPWTKREHIHEMAARLCTFGVRTEPALASWFRACLDPSGDDERVRGETPCSLQRNAYFFADRNASNRYAVAHERANPPRGGGAKSTGLFLWRRPDYRKEG
jgi:hypothetical protein